MHDAKCLRTYVFADRAFSQPQALMSIMNINVMLRLLEYVIGPLRQYLLLLCAHSWVSQAAHSIIYGGAALTISFILLTFLVALSI